MRALQYPVRNLLLAALAVAGGLLAEGPAARSDDAQDYPARPVTIIVPYAAGGPTDAAIRVVAQNMSTTLGRAFIIENIGGAGGTIGTLRVVKAPPDGYTLLAQQSGIATIPTLYPKMAIDVTKDLTAIGLLNRTYSFLVGRKALPPNNVAELKHWLQKRDTPVSWAHPGVGSSGYINAFVTAQALGAKVTLVPYKGSGAALNDIVAGHVDLTWVGSTLAVPQIKAGTVKAFAAGDDKPPELLPDVPVASAVGLEQADNPVWQMLLAPTDTPAPIRQKLETALRQALASKEVQDAYASVGSSAYPPDQRTAEFANHLLSREVGRMSRVITENNIEVHQ